jgi:hypothetical protein
MPGQSNPGKSPSSPVDLISSPKPQNSPNNYYQYRSADYVEPPLNDILFNISDADDGFEYTNNVSSHH